VIYARWFGSRPRRQAITGYDDKTDRRRKAFRMAGLRPLFLTPRPPCCVRDSRNQQPQRIHLFQVDEQASKNWFNFLVREVAVIAGGGADFVVRSLCNCSGPARFYQPMYSKEAGRRMPG